MSLLLIINIYSSQNSWPHRRACVSSTALLLENLCVCVCVCVCVCSMFSWKGDKAVARDWMICRESLPVRYCLGPLPSSLLDHKPWDPPRNSSFSDSICWRQLSQTNSGSGKRLGRGGSSWHRRKKYRECPDVQGRGLGWRGGERNEGHPKVTWHWAFKTSCLSFQSKLAQTVDQISRGYSNINIYSDKQPPKKPSVSKDTLQKCI